MTALNYSISSVSCQLTSCG